jgi:hypothetical protein
MSAFPTGVHFDVPVVDGDAMGRAFPTMYHGKFYLQIMHINNDNFSSSDLQRLWPFAKPLRAHRCTWQHFRCYGK